MTTKLDPFTEQYLVTALWSSTDDEVPLDQDHGIEDLAPETMEKMVKDAEKFQEENAEAISVGEDSRAGHDFWLTRNGHGAGFWDGDWPEPQAKALTKASEKFGSYDLYVGDDGLIYGT